MNFKSLLKQSPVTTLLLMSFVGLFAYQVLFAGVDANYPAKEDLLNWGANYFSKSMLTEPWRLITSGFLHIGLMHLLFNCYAMYYFGQVAEPMLGSVKFLLLFLLSVVGGNMLNSYVTFNYMTDNGTPITYTALSAGASGGIMGIGMCLLIFALFKVYAGGRRLNLTGLLFVMAINLMYGFIVPGIDNAGHIGGAMVGALLAFIFALVWQWQSKMLRNYFYFIMCICIIIGFYLLWQSLNLQVLEMIGMA
ncbi:MAG: rhomboid family intramembrane serine protease [Gammaproteobacteria bacterium]|nr:MAG: rhomboid family intramembrane serine protease [Gammaproteobacteria bacterium]